MSWETLAGKHLLCYKDHCDECKPTIENCLKHWWAWAYWEGVDSIEDSSKISEEW